MKRLVALAVVAAVITAYAKRPVKQPAATGVWGPAERQRASH